MRSDAASTRYQDEEKNQYADYGDGGATATATATAIAAADQTWLQIASLRPLERPVGSFEFAQLARFEFEFEAVAR